MLAVVAVWLLALQHAASQQAYVGLSPAFPEFTCRASSYTWQFAMADQTILAFNECKDLAVVDAETLVRRKLNDPAVAAALSDAATLAPAFVVSLPSAMLFAAKVGGPDSASWRMNLLELSTLQMTARTAPIAASSPPAAEVAACYVAGTSSRAPFVFTFGGVRVAGDTPTASDVHTLSLDTWQWTKVTPASAAPSARSRASVAQLSDSRVVLFGGCGSACTADVWVFDPPTAAWTAVSSTNGLPSGMLSSGTALRAVLIDQSLWVPFIDDSDANKRPQLARFDVTGTRKWSTLAFQNRPRWSALVSLSLVPFTPGGSSSTIVVFSDTAPNNRGSLDVAASTPTWNQLPAAAPAYPGQQLHALASASAGRFVLALDYTAPRMHLLDTTAFAWTDVTALQSGAAVPSAPSPLFVALNESTFLLAYAFPQAAPVDLRWRLLSTDLQQRWRWSVLATAPALAASTAPVGLATMEGVAFELLCESGASSESMTVRVVDPNARPVRFVAIGEAFLGGCCDEGSAVALGSQLFCPLAGSGTVVSFDTATHKWNSVPGVSGASHVLALGSKLFVRLGDGGVFAVFDPDAEQNTFLTAATPLVTPPGGLVFLSGLGSRVLVFVSHASEASSSLSVLWSGVFHIAVDPAASAWDCVRSALRPCPSIDLARSEYEAASASLDRTSTGVPLTILLPPGSRIRLAANLSLALPIAIRSSALLHGHDAIPDAERATIDCGGVQGSSSCISLRQSSRQQSRPTVLHGVNIEAGGFRGRAVRAVSRWLQLRDVAVTGFAGVDHGGALLASEQSRIGMTNCRFSNLTARFAGGAVHVTSSSLTLDSCVFDSCHVTDSEGRIGQFGGGAVAAYSSRLIIDDTLIANSTAFSVAGALFLYFSNAVVSGSELRGCSAYQGGAIDAESLSELTMVNTRLVHNSASVAGAVQLVGTHLYGDNLTFADNNAEDLGGGCVACYESVLTMTGHSAFVRCSAAGGGGAIYLWDSTMDVEDGVRARSHGNVAAYGAFVATPPSGLRFVNMSAAQQLQRPGVAIRPPIVLAIVDEFGSTVVTDSALVSAHPSERIFSSAAVGTQRGLAIFDSLQLRSANTSVQLLFIALLEGQRTVPVDQPIELRIGECGAGRVLTSDRCTLCAPGRYAAAGARVCDTCEPGRSTAMSGASSCDACPPGKYARGGQWTTCADCVAGKFASAPSSSLCLDCELGRFSRDGAPRCSQCGNGSVANGISARCFDCVPGRYSDAERVLCVPCKPGQTSGPRADVCVDCESGKVALSPGSALCVSCAQGLFANANHTLCESCPAGRGGYNGACVDCQPGQVSQDDVCRSCGDSGYTLQPRQTTCLPCTGRGFSCVDGWPQIAEGFWGFVDPTGRVVARQCPPDVCNGGPLFSADSCAANRQPVESNPLCGQCKEGAAYALGSTVCVPCESPRGAYVFLLLTLCWLGVMVLHTMSQATTGEKKVLLFFLSCARFIVGPSNSWLSWLGVVEQNTEQSWWHTCVIPFSPYSLVLFRLSVPLIAMVQLLLTGVLAALLAPKCCPVPRASLRPLLPRTAFLRTLLSLVVTSFTTVCFLTLDTLSCVDGKGTRVVFSLPAMECAGSKYSALRALLIALLVLWLFGVPALFAALVVITRRRQLRREAAAEREEPLLRLQLQAGGGGSLDSGVSFGLSALAAKAAPHAAPSAVDFIVEAYRPETWFWESVSLLRRVLLVSVSVLITDDAQLRAQMVTAVCVLLLLLHLACQPYRDATTNRLETLSLLALVVIASFSDHTSFNHGMRTGVAVAVTLIVLAVSALLVWSWCYKKRRQRLAQAEPQSLGEQALAEVAASKGSKATGRAPDGGGGAPLLSDY